MSDATLQLLPYGDQGDGTYANPVLFADYSDPDVIAVGEDYYLTASSFQCTPGLPVLHSRDLVNWRIVSYAMETFPDPAYDALPQHGKGVWAPALRYHDGRFWIFFGAPDEGIYMTTADRAEGPWTPLHLVQAGAGLIDPCPFWDDDGQAYLVRGQAASRCNGVNSLLTLHRMAPDGTKLLDDGVVIVDGHFHHPIVEGPKLYKRNSYYYIFAPAGGVKGGWQTVFRSRSIDGPYEDRIVLTQGNTPINGPHQGGWVETAFGEHWFLHFQDRGPYGRVVHLQPMWWEADDWPRMGQQTKAIDVCEPALHHAKPKTAEPTVPLRLPTSDSFAHGVIGPQWQWMANMRADWWSSDTDASGIRLSTRGVPSGAKHWLEAGNILVQKPLDPRFEVTVSVNLAAVTVGDEAALLLISGVSGGLVLERRGEAFVLSQRVLDQTDPTIPAREVITREWASSRIRLRLVMYDGACRFAYEDPEAGTFLDFGETILPQDAAWMGARIGLCALNSGTAPSGGSAVFTDFLYEPLA